MVGKSFKEAWTEILWLIDNCKWKTKVFPWKVIFYERKIYLIYWISLDFLFTFSCFDFPWIPTRFNLPVIPHEQTFNPASKSFDAIIYILHRKWSFSSRISLATMNKTHIIFGKGKIPPLQKSKMSPPFISLSRKQKYWMTLLTNMSWFWKIFIWCF